MKLSQFKYDLPKELIASTPPKNRDESRLMVLNRKDQTIEHKKFRDVVQYYGEGDVFVINNTKVFPALLTGEKEKTGAKITVFLLRELNPESRLWDVLVDPARKIRIGNKLYFGEDDSLVAEVIDNTTSRGRTLRFLFDGPYEDFKKTIEFVINSDLNFASFNPSNTASMSLPSISITSQPKASHLARKSPKSKTSFKSPSICLLFQSMVEIRLSTLLCAAYIAASHI
jgi:hypothetical protein